MSDETKPPPLLTLEELKPKVEGLGKQLEKSGCVGLATQMASHIVDMRDGGTMKNIVTLIPALAAKPGDPAGGIVDIKGDTNCDKKIDTDEGAALLMAGIHRAKAEGATDIPEFLKTFNPDAQFYQEADAMLEKIQPGCAAPLPNDAPPRPGKHKGR